MQHPPSTSDKSDNELFSKLFAWAQLVRLPNVFTAIADVLAGIIVAHQSWGPWQVTVLLIGSVVCLYWGGMVLNDVYDVDRDRQANRGRPLADGRIALMQARVAGYALMLVGVALATLVVFDPTPYQYKYLTPLIALATAVVIWLYDGPLKATIAGPWLMGMCRVGSMLLGLSVGWWLEPIQSFGSTYLWAAAIGHGVYVAGITWAARREAERHQNWTLLFGWIVCVVGISFLGCVPALAPQGMPLRVNPFSIYPLAIACLAMPWLRRAINTIVDPRPTTIQAAVKQAILSIIFFDALLAIQFGEFWHGAVVCSLMIPANALGKKFRST